MPIVMIVSILSFIIAIWYITLIDFQMLNQHGMPEINCTWSWLYNPFSILLDLFASILLRIFMSVFMNDADF